MFSLDTTLKKHDCVNSLIVMNCMLGMACMADINALFIIEKFNNFFVDHTLIVLCNAFLHPSILHGLL